MPHDPTKKFKLQSAINIEKYEAGNWIEYAIG